MKKYDFCVFVSGVKRKRTLGRPEVDFRRFGFIRQIYPNCRDVCHEMTLLKQTICCEPNINNCIISVVLLELCVNDLQEKIHKTTNFHSKINRTFHYEKYSTVSTGVNVYNYTIIDTYWSW